MLEEALEDERPEAAEATAVAMLSFLESLPVGGAAAEVRFYKSLFVPLCDRAFGTLLLDQDGQYRRKGSAWLAAAQRWASSQRAAIGSQTSLGSPANKMMRSSQKNDPIVVLLDKGLSSAPGRIGERPATVVGPSLLDILTGESENRPSVAYPFPFLALPKQFQEAWKVAADLATISQSQAQRNRIPFEYIADNYKELFLRLLRFKPAEQHQLISYHQKMLTEQHGASLPFGSPFGMASGAALYASSSSPMRQSMVPRNSPSAATSVLDHKSQNEKDAASPPMFLLGTLEYYLVSFLHFALAPPAIANAPAYSPVRRSRRVELHGVRVYSHLFHSYCRYFLPPHWSMNASDTGTSSRHDTELFLRLVIALWIESQSALRTTPDLVGELQERHQRRSMGVSKDAQQAQLRFDLGFSFDLTAAAGSVDMSCSTMLKRGLRFLVQHVLAQPQVQIKIQQVRANRSVSSPSSPKYSNPLDHGWCLTEAMTALQLPLYNYIRAVFRFAPIHSSDSSFSMALDMWLNWLEPWNSASLSQSSGDDSGAASNSPVKHHQQQLRSLMHRTGNRKSYDHHLWEPYVAANLSIYTVPLAIFLRRVRELDFSQNSFRTSYHVVCKVLDVFTPELIDSINRLLRDDTPWNGLVAAQYEKLGPFGPPSRIMDLKSCQSDMRLLLEEMQMQHYKNVGNMDFMGWTSAKMEGIFGRGALSGEEKSLLNLAERAKLLVGLPDTYTLFTGAEQCDGGVQDAVDKHRKPSRTKEGMLTEEGREQLLRGEVVCSPLDVRPESTRMATALVGTYEITVLVIFFVWLSMRINESIGLSNSGFKVNLRFLADYRNLVFCWFGFYLSWRFLLACFKR